MTTWVHSTSTELLKRLIVRAPGGSAKVATFRGSRGRSEKAASTLPVDVPGRKDRRSRDHTREPRARYSGGTWHLEDGEMRAASPRPAAWTQFAMFMSCGIHRWGAPDRGLADGRPPIRIPQTSEGRCAKIAIGGGPIRTSTANEPFPYSPMN